jgi:uncharacterized membrane protein
MSELLRPFMLLIVDGVGGGAVGVRSGVLVLVLVLVLLKDLCRRNFKSHAFL